MWWRRGDDLSILSRYVQLGAKSNAGIDRTGDYGVTSFFSITRATHETSLKSRLNSSSVPYLEAGGGECPSCVWTPELWRKMVCWLPIQQDQHQRFRGFTSCRFALDSNGNIENKNWEGSGRICCQMFPEHLILKEENLRKHMLSSWYQSEIEESH